MNDTVVE